MLPRQWSLRTVLSIPFALVMSAVVLLMALTHYRTVNEMGEREAVNFLRSSNAQAASELRRLLALPFHLQRMAALQIAHSGYYKPGDLRQVQQFLEQSFYEVYLGDDTHVSMLQLGTEDGSFVAVSYRPEDGLALHLKDQRTADVLLVSDLQTGDVKRSRTGYDPRLRPWYRPVALSRVARWTPLYAGSSNPFDVGISATHPLFSEATDRDGERHFLGVLGSDISLKGLTQILRAAPLSTTFNSDVSYIVDMDGRLVAVSDGGALVTTASAGGTPALLQATESPNPLVAHSAAVLPPQSNEEGVYHVYISGKDYVVHAAPFVDAKGIDWRIVSVVAKEELTQRSTQEANLALLLAAGFVALGLYLALLVVQRAAIPIRQTALAVTGLAHSDVSSHMQELQDLQLPQISTRITEVALLLVAFQGMAQRIAQQMQHLKHLALHDSVTGLLNTHGFASAAQWSGHRPAMLVKLGVVNYAVVRALMPSVFDDELVRALAKRLSEAAPGALLIARGEGEAFWFLFLDTTAAQREAALAALQLAFKTSFVVGADELSLHAALGVTLAQCHAQEVATRLMPEASLALAAVVRRPGAHLMMFDDSLYTEAAAGARAQVELRHAVAAQEFVVYFQPIVDLQTEAVAGVESLLRWPHKIRGMVPPSEFIALAEETGQIIALGEWVMSRACAEVARLIAELALPQTFFLNVNVSVRQLLQSDFVDLVKKTLAHSGLAPGNLKIEITESLLMQENSATLETIDQLQELGVKFALDDFGTGYSSLSYLNSFRFDAIKVDRSLLLGGGSSECGRLILRAAQELIHALKAQSVVEGIETREQAALATDLGFELGQGYLFARAMPVADLRKYLMAQTWVTSAAP